MQNKNIKNNRLNSGFTLVETLVSLLILSLVFVSVISLMSSSIFSARYAKNEIKATYLAQENIDYIRNLRDSIGFQQNNWISFVTDLETNCGNSNPDGCIINKPFLVGHFSQPTFSVVPASPLSNSEFRSIINTTCVDIFSICDQINITSTVFWKNGDILKSRSLTSTLTQWN